MKRGEEGMTIEWREKESEENERKRRLLSPLKAPDSIETRPLYSKLQNNGRD